MVRRPVVLSWAARPSPLPATAWPTWHGPSPPAAGRGIGSALLAEAIDQAGKAGAHKIALQVWPHNSAAIALYERFGFQREGYLTRHYRRRSGELWDAVIMGLRLD